MTRNTRYITCPYCEYENRDSWEVNFGSDLEGETTTQCKRCGEEFIAHREVTVEYSTWKP